MVKILILCVGNSVRSQMAEGYFNFYAANQGIFFSAGLEKSKVNPYAIRVMAEDNIDLSEHLSKSLNAYSGLSFDYLITVCDPENKDFLKDITYKSWIHLPIPDPSEKEHLPESEKLVEFRAIRDQVKRLVLKFIGQELLQSQAQESYA